MSKQCGLERNFIDKMSNYYDSAKSGNTEAAASYELYMEVAKQAVNENAACWRKIFEVSSGKFNEDMFKDGAMEIPRLNY